MDIDITRDEMWILITWGREEEDAALAFFN
jgi:hypothetical protein